MQVLMVVTVMMTSWNPVMAMVYQRVHLQTSNKKNKVQMRQLKEEIVCVICKALMLVNQMHGLCNDFEDVVTLVKDLLFHNDCNRSALNYWPRNWRETEKLLKEFDYRGPKEYFISLDGSHPYHWDLMESPSSLCKH